MQKEAILKAGAVLRRAMEDHGTEGIQALRKTPDITAPLSLIQQDSAGWTIDSEGYAVREVDYKDGGPVEQTEGFALQSGASRSGKAVYSIFPAS